MCGAQVGVGLVEAVPHAVVLQRDRLPGVVVRQDAVGVLAGAAGGGDGVFVEVVAEVEDHVDVLVREVPVGGEVAVVVRLAGDGGQGQRAVAGSAAGCGAGAAGGAGPAAGAEAVVEAPVGVEAVHVHMDAVPELRVGGGGPAPDDPAEAFVAGDLPADLDTPGGQSAVRLVGAGRESRPQQHGVRQRVSGRHPQGEGVLGDLPGVELGGGRGARAGQVDGEGERGGGSGDGEETAAAHAGAEALCGAAQHGGMASLSGRPADLCGCHMPLPCRMLSEALECGTTTSRWHVHNIRMAVR